MQQRQDYIESQIDMLSKILRKLLEKLLKLKSDDANESELNAIYSAQVSVISEELTLKDLINLPNQDLIKALLKDYNYDNENIKLLADVLYDLSKKTSANFNAAEKALILYNHYISNAKTNIDFIAFGRREELAKASNTEID